MDNLDKPLLASQGESNDKQDSKLVNTSTLSLKGDEEISQKIKDQQALRHKFEEIKTSVIESFTFKNTKLPFQCVIIRVSINYSLIVGAHTDEDELAIMCLQTGSLKKSFKTGNGVCSCMLFNEDQSRIFIGTSEGKLLSYSFPEFADPVVYDIGSDSVRFDYHKDGFLYASSFSSLPLKMINIATNEIKVIGRFQYAEYVRVNADNSYVAVCSDSQVVVFSRQYKWTEFILKLKSEEEENEEYDYDAPLKTCEIEFTSYGDKIGISYLNYIQIWNVGDWTVEKKFEMYSKGDISSFKFNRDDEYIVAVGMDHSINCWKFDSKTSIPKFMNQEGKYIDEDDKDKEGKKEEVSFTLYDLEIDEDRNLIYTHQRNSENSHIWKGIFLDKEIFEDSGFYKGGQRAITCKTKNQFLSSDSADYGFSVYDISSLKLVYRVKTGTVPWELTFNGDDEKFLLVGSNRLIYQYNTNDYSLVKQIANNEAGDIYAMRCSKDYIISGGSSKLIVIQNHDGVLQNTIAAHEDQISAMKIHANYLITGDFSGAVFIHMMESWDQYAKLHRHTSWLRTIEVFSNGDTLVTVGRDKKCIFWSLYDKTDIKEIELSGPIDSCYLSKDETSYVVSTQTGEVIVYNLPSFREITKLHYKEAEHQRFAFDPDEKYIIVSNSNGIFRTISPISNGIPIIIDNNINIPKIKYFLTEKRNKPLANDSWIIAPYMVNSLHYYAYENTKSCLKKAMLNGSPYLSSVVGTPIRISILKGNTEATGAIISQLKIRVSKDVYALETIGAHLIQLNKGGFKGLDELYTACLIDSPQPKLPDSCSEKVELPVISYALTNHIHAEDFIGPIVDDGAQRISFLISTIRMNLEPGSKESIDFLESLLDCSNTDIFKTKFIQTILYDKWEQVRWINYTNALVFITYLATLSYHIILRDKGENDHTCLIIALVANILLFLYEVVQMGLDPLEYIKGIWNYIDLSRAGFFYAYFIYTVGYDNDIEWLLIVVTILSWTRGITLFALSTSTRYMVGLIGSVLIDIIPFAIVVFYSIVAFFFINLSAGKGDADLGINMYQSYMDAIGNFNTDEANAFQFVFVVVASIFNLIIMMNLLISIIGSTYGTVNDEALVEDLKQLTDLIIESESLLFTKRNSKKKTILQICELYTPPEIVGAEELKLRFRTVRTDLNLIRKQGENFMKQSEANAVAIFAKQDLALAKFDTIKKDIVTDLKNTIEDLKKQLIESMKKDDEEPEDKAQKLFLCLNGHNLKEIFAEERYCDICRVELNGVDALNCGLCNFDMCVVCAAYYYSHNDVKTGLKCNGGHVLLHFHDINEIIQEKNYETQQCRFCNTDFEGEGFHCLYCAYSACKTCADIYEVAIKSKEKNNCKGGHQLKWKHKELYTKESLRMKCKACAETFAGSGFYCCTDCSEYYCLQCFNEEFLTGEREGGQAGEAAPEGEGDAEGEVAPEGEGEAEGGGGNEEGDPDDQDS